MAKFHPLVWSNFLSEAEQKVWDTFQKLDDTWHVFYSARERDGTSRPREVDFILIRYNRIFYCEVKGGVVIVDQPAGANVIWRHFKRSGEEIEGGVDPRQLWNAKRAVTAAIQRSADYSPYSLRFREHEFYIFPHTSRAVTNGQNFEWDTTHYTFEEDLNDLPQYLQWIVDSEKGVFIQRERIERIIESLDKLVAKAGGGIPPSIQLAQSRPGKPVQAQPIATDYVASPLSKSQPPRRFDHAWRRIFPWLCAAGLLLLYLVWPSDEPAKTAQPLKTTQTSAVVRPPESRPTPPAPARSPAATPIEHPESALPTFIPKVALTDVEQAVMLARQKNETIPWQTGKHHGFVTLYEIENDRCLKHRITRNDVNPMEVGFTRRC